MIGPDLVDLSDADYAAMFPPQAPEPPSLPVSVPRLWARLALNEAGLLASTEAVVATAGGATLIWYQDALNWQRANPIVQQLATALNLSATQVDALFIRAAALGAEQG